MAFTEEQSEAIHRKGANILVSAAAGSGKTTVLVARIINKILNEKVDIDKLLIVTFTDAAASEMRERILKSLYNEIDKNPDDENLQKQLMLINKSHISTITSFCLDVVRNNFFEIGLSANFRIGDPTEIEIMKQEAIEKVFEDKYEKNDKNFEKLVELYTPYSDDQPLKDLVLKIYDFIQSKPYPEKWLDESIEKYNIDIDQDFAKTLWGKIILDYAKTLVENYLSNIIKAKNSLENISNLADCYEILCDDIVNLKSIDFSNWDKLYETLQKIEWRDWSRKRKYEEFEKELKDQAKNIRDEAVSSIKKIRDDIINIKSEESNSEIKAMYNVLKSLENLILDFKNEFNNRKAEKNIVDFSDIEHHALNILVDENGNKTDIAKKYQFNEILIDEYQDSNLVQEKILNSISNGKNIFMVGDVKQSIYRFRQARPELFLDKYKKYQLVDRLNGNYAKQNEENSENVQLNGSEENSKELQFNENQLNADSKILLYKNFRSRQEVIDFTNVIFQNIMSNELGEIDYGEEEYLNIGATFEEPRINNTPELYIIDTNTENAIDKFNEKNKNDNDNNSNNNNINNKNVNLSEEDEQIDNVGLEANLLCRKIKELKEQGISYKEMVVLLRSTSNVAPVYEKEMINQGIPVYSDTASEYLESIEIDTIISLLKIIDNPLQDIPLVTVLRSKIGNFNDNELTQLRLNQKEGLFYYALKKEADLYENLNKEDEREEITEIIEKSNEQKKITDIIEKPNEQKKITEIIENADDQEEITNRIENNKEFALAKKSYDFLKMIEEFRNLEKTVPLDQLIWTIYAKTGYYYYVRLMPNGKLRQANLRKLFEKAKDYEKISLKGLFNFITFIEKIVGNNNLQEAKIINENDDVVRIMSIHKSKGLEFPVVFLCNVGRKFNEQDMKNKIVLDQDLGIGANYIDNINEYSTLAKQAINLKIKKEMISEEMRILYVALTRAKEKLIIIGSDRNALENYNKKEIELRKYHGKEKAEKISPILISKYRRYLDWIELVKKYTSLNLNVNFIKRSDLNQNDDDDDNENEQLKNIGKYEINAEKYKRIDELLKWKYEYETDTPSKTSVTALKNIELNFENKEITILDDISTKKVELETLDSKLISNIKNKKLTPAEKGTLIHLALQKLNNEDIDNMIKNLKIDENSREFLIQNKNIFENYINSELFEELKKAKLIQKETPFYMDVNYKNTDEKVLIQGVIDLYFVDKDDNLILVDYKTDKNVDEETLKQRYLNQLNMYEIALEKSLNMKVSKKIIYSTTLNKCIEIM